VRNRFQACAFKCKLHRYAEDEFSHHHAYDSSMRLGAAAAKAKAEEEGGGAVRGPRDMFSGGRGGGGGEGEVGLYKFNPVDP
jgi:hypothetical protein